MSDSANLSSVVPANLSFLAIYNPSLGDSDDSVQKQIVYYYDKRSNGRRRFNKTGGGDVEESKTEINEKLRRIGLAQGMIQFAAGFSEGAPIDFVETEKSRIIMHNIEDGWWMLASVALTRLPRPASSRPKSESSLSETKFEYSAREVSSPALLLQQILRAHQIFLLHHGVSLSTIWSHVSRDKFCGFLKRFWDSFLRGWDVLLHGNPAVDVYNSIKLSAGGELGIGVGEEEWGSGEREVLEGFIERTDGLVDLLVSRFAHSRDVSDTKGEATVNAGNAEHHGTGEYPKPTDGVVFSGIGALTRSSIRNVTAWIEWLAMHGTDTYGVRDNPTSNVRRRRGRKKQHDHNNIRRASPQLNELATSSKPQEQFSGIPSPIIPSKHSSTKDIKTEKRTMTGAARNRPPHNADVLEGSLLGTEVMKYLTFGVYGSTWGLPAGRPAPQQMPGPRPVSAKISEHDMNPSAGPNDSEGYFLIGLLGNLENDTETEDELSDNIATMNDTSMLNNRTLVRSIHVERVRNADRTKTDSNAGSDIPPETYRDRLRVLVYVQQPFIFTFLFEMQTDSLVMSSFYRSLHYQLGPLQRPLSKSTDPEKVTQRLWDAASTKSTVPTRNSQPIQDLVYDPARLTIHTTIPNIPDPSVGLLDRPVAWTRVEALGVHAQMLNMYASTRRDTSELERTCKTSRGWWVVWMRLPHPAATPAAHGRTYREAYLIRRSSDSEAQKLRTSSSGLGFSWGGGGGGGESSGSGPPARLAEGIGIDARQYIEGLLSLNR